MVTDSISIQSNYDDELLKYEQFKKRPFSLPHLGSKLKNHNNVLFIMESHYVDTSFFQYQFDKVNLKTEVPNLFYNTTNEGFTKAFKEYLNTRQIIRDSESTNKKLAKGKSVYRKLSSVVREGFNLKIEKDGSPLDYVGIYNYFQRPSYEPSASIKLCEEDRVVAYEALTHILNVVDFKKIIFISAKAYDSFFIIDSSNNKLIHQNRKIFRGAHPRSWGFSCSYEKDIKWRQWILNLLIN